MKKLFTFIAAVLFAGSIFADTATATLAKGTTNSYDDCTINEKFAVKMGKSGAGGNMTITVGAGATSLTFHAVAWKGEGNQKVTIAAPAGVTVTPNEITVAANDALSGTSKAFSVTPESNYEFTVSISGANAGAVLTLSSAKRAFVWDATYVWGAVSDPYINADNIDLGTIIIDAEPAIYQTELLIEVSSDNLTQDIDVSTNSSKITITPTYQTIDMNTTSDISVSLASGDGELDEQIIFTSGETMKTIAITGHVYRKLTNPGTALAIIKGTNAVDTVTVNNIPAVKAGTSKNNGDMTIAIPTNAKKLYFMAAAWSGGAGNVAITETNVTLSSSKIKDGLITLSADAGIAGTVKNFEMQQGDWSVYQFVIDLSDVKASASVKLESGTAKRFVVWDATYEVSSPPTGLENIFENKAIKVIEDNKIVIKRNNIKYNILGQSL